MRQSGLFYVIISLMTDANFRFMSRQLLVSELGGQLAGEESGLLLSHGPRVWVGINDLDSVGDHEEMVSACRQYASDTNGSLAGMILPYEPAQGNSEKLLELDESMYLLDLPRQEDEVPDNVQMAFTSGKHANAAGTELRQASWQDEAVRELISQDGDATESLVGPALGGHPAWPQMLECHTLSKDGSVVAVAGTISNDLATRLCYIIVDPKLRRQGLGRVLVGRLGHTAQEQGRMILNCWTQRSGRLRYFTSKAGFEDRLSIRWYIDRS